MEREVFELVNRHREKKTLKPLIVDATLVRVARAHSRDMADGKVPVGHDGFQLRSTGVRALIRFRSIAENIATNKGYVNPARTAVENWLLSDGHKVNIEGRYNITGVGIVTNGTGIFFFTQLFVLE